MQVDGSVARSYLVDAANTLAGHVLDALGDVGDVGLADYVDSHSDVTAALGAVRLLGADVFAPQVLLGRPLGVRDADVLADAFAAYPPSLGSTTHEQDVQVCRDWAMSQLLARLSQEGEPVTLPADAVPLDQADGWQHWSVRVAQLSPLALPGMGGPVVEAVRDGKQALARGIARAMLRRDHVTAARLARWMALLVGTGVAMPLEPIPLLNHIRLHAGAGPRLLLDLAIAYRVLETEPA